MAIDESPYVVMTHHRDGRVLAVVVDGVEYTPTALKAALVAAAEVEQVTRHWEEEVRENGEIRDALEDAGFVFDPDDPPNPVDCIRSLATAAAEVGRLRAEGAEQLAALELALPVLEKHEPCGYYCDEDHGHIDHPATYAVYRAINEHPLGAALLEEVARLRAAASALVDYYESEHRGCLVDDSELELRVDELRAALKHTP